MFVLYAIRSTLSAIRDKSIILHHKSQIFEHFGVLMAKKHLFSRLLKKAILMALWTKAGLCVKSSLLEQCLPRTPSRPKTSVISVAKNLCNLLLLFRAFLWLKNPFNQRNLRLINDLRLFKALYICRESFTNHPFLCKTNPISEKVK